MQLLFNKIHARRRSQWSLLVSWLYEKGKPGLLDHHAIIVLGHAGMKCACSRPGQQHDMSHM